MSQTQATRRVRQDPALQPPDVVGAASSSGGWPYYRGRAPRIEPTAWALLGLGHRRDVAAREAIRQGRRFLHGCQRADGLLVEPGLPGANYAWNGLALLALNDRDDGPVVDRLATGLLSARGIRIEGDSTAVRVDRQLQAWSWTEGTFSWLEPTAWCLLALKVRRVQAPIVAERIAAAEAVIADRVCQPAGWNYGNSQVLTQDLRPYVPTTALALLAMQDKRSEAFVARGLDWLLANALSERATLALSLAAIALAVFDRPVDTLLAALEAQVRRTAALENVHLQALAGFALTLPLHGARAVRIP
jgi:hypothetical protein